ncbi:MAG: carboxypeptidase regulatory-like domain-containing protein [Acidobacteriota bacterium]|jgi:hypothetical protein
MRPLVFRFALALILVVTFGMFAFAQGSSSQLAGTVLDQTGGVIPGADVTVKNDVTGEVYQAVTAENGTFAIPSLPPGTYTATVTVPKFKQAKVTDIKLIAGAVSTIRVTLEVGGINEVITVQANAENLQASSANVTTTMTVNQITKLPLATRNVLDFLIMLPGVNTTTIARSSTINGLPNATFNITIDGVPPQDQYLKGSAWGDGFYSMISPRLDAIEEVTVSSATPGAESAGQGAVQIKFVTRSGNNDYHGSAYWYHRNPALNSNYWFNNRDKTPTYDGSSTPCTTAQMQTEFDKCKAPRDRLLFNQPGGRIGGPITLPKRLFGPLGFNGKDKAFFFINYEEFRQPTQITRTRTFFSPGVENGVFPYTVGGVTQTVNLWNLAAANGQTATPDPTIQKLLNDIRAAAKDPNNGVTEQLTSDPLLEYYLFTNSGPINRRFLTTRGDFNLTSRHRLEVSWNFHRYVPTLDFGNGYDPAYPGSPNIGEQSSNRFTASTALRSTITPRLVNEARFGLLGGNSLFNQNVTRATYSGSVYNQDGFALSLSPISNAYRTTAQSRRNTPDEAIEDTLSWTRGTHSFSFGGSWTNIGGFVWQAQIVSPVTFGVNTAYDPAAILFNSTNGPKNFPGASGTQYGNAQSVYALLTGRVSQISGLAILSEATNQYTYNGAGIARGHMREMGWFAQDSWRIRPGFTFTYGVRWEVQFPFIPLNSAMTTNTLADLWGLSGPQTFGNGKLYTPGNPAGTAPTWKQFVAGTPAFNTSWTNFAPSLGFAWTPKGKGGALSHLLGESGKTVVRGGFSLAFNRNGLYDYIVMYSNNPGVTINAARNATNGNLVYAGETWPILFRDKSRMGPPAFAATPVYPIQSTSISDQVNLFDPNTRTPYTLSWSFGIQRELTKDMALEVRYVATRNLQPWSERSVNEQNLVENGFMDEFKKAMANLQANQAAYPTTSTLHNSFAYTGAAGTSPLPITLAYFSGYTAAQATDPTKYTSSSFTSNTFVNTLAKYGANPGSYALSLWSTNATFRANALAAGLPANEFVVNPTVASGGAWISTNGGFNRYDAMVIELRRRLSKGLLIQANYTWAKAINGARASYRTPYIHVTGDTLPHAFKVNWVYELPIGGGKLLLSSSHGILDRVIGGWEVEGTGRIQAGNLLNFGNVRLVGMTLKDLQNAVGLRFDDKNKVVYYEPEDIRINTIAAFNYSATTTATNTTYYSPSWGVPTGRYLAPASQADCLQVVSGDCAGYSVYVRGPMFMRFDIGLVKRIRFSESKNFELRGEFLNAFNAINFYGATCAGSGSTCGLVTTAYTDALQQQDPGGRLIQIVVRINF